MNSPLKESSMKNFLDKNFLLSNETAKELYHDFACKMPIFDYHNHLNPQEIYEDVVFENLSQVWLGGDHYKWRILRTLGVEEERITGEASDVEKFKTFAEAMPYTLGNPMYHWSHLELQRYFDIEDTLNEDNWEEIYEVANKKLQSKEFSVRNLIIKSNVRAMCTTDDPKDDLKYHTLLKEDFKECKVLPTFRPDNIIHLDKVAFLPYVDQLNSMDFTVKTFDDVLTFLSERVEYFHQVGCRLSDHGLDSVMYLDATKEEVSKVFAKALAGESLSYEELSKYKGYVLSYLGKLYNAKGWVMQLHIGPMRNNSTRMFQKLGADVGFDSINDGTVAVALSRLLDSMDITNELPKTILYCLNPADNATLATMLGNFQGAGAKGKIQFGSGWWFMDTKQGMIKQMEDLSSMGLLSCFVGMLTDSRSFLSFPRHEYFRRILCNEIGKLVENGEYPKDMKRLGAIVENICYNNISEYIGV